MKTRLINQLILSPGWRQAQSLLTPRRDDGKLSSNVALDTEPDTSSHVEVFNNKSPHRQTEYRLSLIQMSPNKCDLCSVTRVSRRHLHLANSFIIAATGGDNMSVS